MRIETLFIDVGGVLLTNGWDRNSRKAAAEKFYLDLAELNIRHHLTFDTYEIGKLSLDDYLDRVVFYEPRDFSKDEFKRFIYAQSQPYPETIDLVRGIKGRNGIKVAVISNEGRELTEYRIRKFGLAEFVDFFVCSCFVRFRKPDTDIFRMALDLAQALPGESAYLDDRALFVEVARTLGMQAVRHIDAATTRRAFADLGLI
ncbi:MAG: HAD hydrolase-like protein [Acidobacteriota bacterium]|nr:HAD hydrolase-like protein [Acidobacteriota bacterium]